MVPGVYSNFFKSHDSGFTCRSQKRFPLCYSSSKALSDDISLTLKLKTAFNPWLFCVKQKLSIIWSTIVVYLASLAKK